MADTPQDGPDSGLEKKMQELSTAAAPPGAAPSPLSSSSEIKPHTHQQSDDWDDWEAGGDEEVHQDKSTHTTTVPPSPLSPSPSPPPPLPLELNPQRIQYYIEQIRTYIHDLADPHILQQVQQRLDAKSYQSVAEYYMNNAKLAQYTIEHEVNRMDYTVISKNKEGETKTLAEKDPAAIRSIFNEKDLVWRFANQSIFAEILQEVQLLMLRPDLDVAVVSKDSRFTVCVCVNEEEEGGEESLEALSLFHVVLAGGGGGGGGIDTNTHTHTQAADPKGVIEVATVLGEISLNISQQTLTQTVKLVKLKPVFDDVIHHVAQTLAWNEARNDPHAHTHTHTHTEEEAGIFGGRIRRAARERLPLGVLRGQVLATAGQGLQGLVAVGREAVTSVGKMIEEAAALEEEGGEGEGGGGKGEGGQGAVPLAHASSSPPPSSSSPVPLTTALQPQTRTRTRPTRGGGGGTNTNTPTPTSTTASAASFLVEKVQQHSEGVMEGIVGGIGRVVGQEAYTHTNTPGRGGGGGGGGLKLYRRDDDGGGGKEEREKEKETEGGGGLWGLLAKQYSGDMQAASPRTDTHTHSQTGRSSPPPPPLSGGGGGGGGGGPLPAPPSSYLKGFVTGIGGFIASQVEAVINDDEDTHTHTHTQPEEIGLGEMLRRKEQREKEEEERAAAAKGGEAPFQLYKR